MKKIITSIIAAIGSIPMAYADGPAPTIEIKRAIVVNGETNTATFNTPTQSTVVVGQSGASNITGFQSAMQFEFKMGETPVNVTNFKVTSATWKLIKTGSLIVWNNTPFGAYHSIGGGSPDYWVFNTLGDVTPTGPNKWVSGLNDNSGTLIPSLSKFQLVNHPVPTQLVTPGQYYTLWYEMTFSYTYDGVLYNRTLIPSETEVMILVVEDIPGFSNESGTPSQIMLQVSDDLVNWVPAPVSVPHPRPTVVQNIIDLVPSTTNVVGLDDSSRRFYRYRQTTFP